MTQIAAVYGAPTPPGRLALALDAAVAALENGGASVARIDLHAAPPDDEAVLLGPRAPSGRVAGLPCPFPGVLKTLLDPAPVSALRGKPVGLVVVAASDHHYLGVDRHLRDVLSWFGALALPVSVYLTSRDFGEDGLGDSARQRRGSPPTCPPDPRSRRRAARPRRWPPVASAEAAVTTSVCPVMNELSSLAEGRCAQSSGLACRPSGSSNRRSPSPCPRSGRWRLLDRAGTRCRRDRVMLFADPARRHLPATVTGRPLRASRSGSRAIPGAEALGDAGVRIALPPPHLGSAAFRNAPRTDESVGRRRPGSRRSRRRAGSAFAKALNCPKRSTAVGRPRYGPHRCSRRHADGDPPPKPRRPLERTRLGR